MSSLPGVLTSIIIIEHSLLDEARVEEKVSKRRAEEEVNTVSQSLRNIFDANQRAIEEPSMIGPSDKESDTAEKDNEAVPSVRTATSGFVHRLLVFLTMIAFIGNAAFMVHVFWISK